jgi:small subunit ribosomal protein S15
LAEKGLSPVQADPFIFGESVPDVSFTIIKMVFKVNVRVAVWGLLPLPTVAEFTANTALCYNLLAFSKISKRKKCRFIKGEYSLDKVKKTGIIEQFKLHDSDTGSVEVQVAVLTGRINQLTGHMAANRHDYHTQRGLLKLVGRRRRLLAYLSRQDTGRYHSLISRLGLRK